jgi:hypothetical protein
VPGSPASGVDAPAPPELVPPDETVVPPSPPGEWLRERDDERPHALASESATPTPNTQRACADLKRAFSRVIIEPTRTKDSRLISFESSRRGFSLIPHHGSLRTKRGLARSCAVAPNGLFPRADALLGGGSPSVLSSRDYSGQVMAMDHPVSQHVIVSGTP